MTKDDEAKAKRAQEEFFSGQKQHSMAVVDLGRSAVVLGDNWGQRIRYKWKTRRDGKVRPGHRLLNGTVHTYGEPPITNPDTGDRNEPGEDYNCRCMAVPVTSRGKTSDYWSTADSEDDDGSDDDE